jgi:PadR family transcriptional regulator, regulatory protein AphA
MFLGDETGGPFPHRLHLVEPMVGFLDNFYRLLVQWREQTVTEIDDWPDTRGVGLTPDGRKRLERIFAPDP